MNNGFKIDKDVIYEQAEERAHQYFTVLREHLKNEQYKTNLTRDLEDWKKEHISFISSFLAKKKENLQSKDYHSYIQYLNYTGKLNRYLDRSISYIYMRDLGKALNEQETNKSIKESVERLRKQLTKRAVNTNEFSIAKVYRWAQKEKVEITLIWLMDKLKKVRDQLPEGLDPDESQRKLIKIIAGVVMHVIEEMDDDVSSEERKKRLAQAIRLGYSYGLTYPFIDDLLDSKLLSADEKNRYTNLIRTTLTTGVVPELGEWTGENKDFMQFVHAELGEAFEFIESVQKQETLDAFYNDSYMFFQSQETDRNKSLDNPNYTNEEIYIPVILKSAASRIVIRSIIGLEEDEGFDQRTFYYGLYNQLADDFADIFEDMEKDAVTPYTYYLTYHQERNDLINPFELYWTVISFLLHHVYESDPKTREVILSRAINGLKRYKKRLSKEKYDEVMGILTARIPSFYAYIQKIVRKADDVDFLDKLLRDHMKQQLQQERNERENFQETVRTVREKINQAILKKDNLPNDSITDAAHYSLESGGKRLRPIVAWLMAVKGYDLEEESILPLLRALEYMHTASLIFDDLPSQDGADFRRGRPTLHEVFNSSTAELTGLFLTQKAVHEQTQISHSNPKEVLELINYSSYVIAEMCRGQAMDLESKEKVLTLEELNTLCFYKTGIAFEASLLMPAILAGADSVEKETLKTFAYHAGIAFQIKDDLLDISGDKELLGKPTFQDVDNNRSTFVTILGEEGAKKEMWDHYCYGIEALDEMQGNKKFLKYILDYFVNRDH